jgi:putative ABC transport system ATP-binding protein
MTDQQTATDQGRATPLPPVGDPGATGPAPEPGPVGPSAAEREAPGTGPVPGRVPLVRLEGVSKTYGSGEVAVHALRGIDLDVEPGEFVVLLGPSGSGKTTLLNVVGGIEPATEGRVVVDGKDIGSLGTGELTDYRRTTVGFVFQFFNLVPTLTALENVQLVGELVGAPPERSAEALAAVGLGDVLDRFPGAMSGGQQQRVAIARAIVKTPPLLLCDEPTGSLDLETGRQVLAVLRDLGRDRGLTVLLVTHNQAIAAIADRVIHLGSGRIEADQANASPLDVSEVRW